jgi:hypothetical protein
MAATEKQAESLHNSKMAQGRLADLRKWIAIRGWKELPQNVLEWGCDHAWMAAEVHDIEPRHAFQKQKRSVRNWLRSKAPRIAQAERDALIERTITSNKRWSHDQCGHVLGISVRDRQKHSLRFVGAMDDPDYKFRNDVKLAKGAARSRKFRSANGAKPRAEYEANSISKTEPWKQEGFGCRRTWERWRKKAAAEAVNVASASRHLSLRIDSVTDLRHDHVEQTVDSRAPKRPGSSSPVWNVDWIEDPEHPPLAIATASKRPGIMERKAR